MLGGTRPHFPNDPSPEFEGKSGAGVYADSILELDARTGEVLAAIDKAGIKDDTIVIWISDNGATVTRTTPSEIGHGSNRPFRGELGDAFEGSIRTAGMIRWPGKIKPSISNEMISVHDLLPTLANIAGIKLPGNRAYDGIDQTDFFLGKKKTSNRDHLITFIGERVAAVRWKQWRVYPMAVNSTSDTNPQFAGYLGTVQETAGLPRIYNIESDPREIQDVAVNGNAWVMAMYANIVAKYKATLKDHPNPPAPNLTKF